MTIIDQGPSFTVDLECTRSTPGGLIVIGGETIESTHDFAPKGTRVAMVVDPGSPVRAHPHFEEVPPAGTCLEFLESVTDAESADFLEPIEGSIEIGPPHP